MIDKLDIRKQPKNGVRAIAWLISSMVSVFICICFVYFFVGFMSADYEKQHPQYAGDDDLAFGVKIILWIFSSLVFSIPFCVFFARFLGNRLIKRLDRR